MKRIIQQIKELEAVASLSKHEQLVQGIINAIDEKIVVKGDLLPFVNTIINKLGFARKPSMRIFVRV